MMGSGPRSWEHLTGVPVYQGRQQLPSQLKDLILNLSCLHLNTFLLSLEIFLVDLHNFFVSEKYGCVKIYIMIHIMIYIIYICI